MHRTLRVLSVVGVVSIAGAHASPSEAADVDVQTQAQWGSSSRPVRSAAPFGCKGDRIALETANGRNYLTAVVGGGFSMMGNATSVGKFETFRAVDLGNDRVALQVANGNYLVAANGGGLLLNANASSINANSTFKLGWTKDGEWLFLRSASGHYVTAESGGGSVANVAWLIFGANQGFKAICLQGDLDGSDDGEQKPGGSGPSWEPSDDSDGSDSDWTGGGWDEPDTSSQRPTDSWEKPSSSSSKPDAWAKPNTSSSRPDDGWGSTSSSGSSSSGSSSRPGLGG